MVRDFDHRRQGITKIGLAVVLVICTVLVALLLRSMDDVHQAAARTQCINNLKQIGLGLHNFEGTFKRLPPLYGGNVIGTHFTASTKFPRIWGSTHVFINPYIEASYQYSEMRTGEPQHILPSLVQYKDCSTYVCPGDPSTSASANLGGTSYAANAQVFAPLRDETTAGSGEMFGMTDANFCDRGTTVAGIKDGSSNTIGFLHAYSLCGSDKQGTFWLYTPAYSSPPNLPRISSLGRGPRT